MFENQEPGAGLSWCLALLVCFIWSSSVQMLALCYFAVVLALVQVFQPCGFPAVAQSSSLCAETAKGMRVCKFPCGFCARSVKESDRGVPCDVCSKWYHASCLGLSLRDYVALQVEGEDTGWFCPTFWVRPCPLRTAPL